MARYVLLLLVAFCLVPASAALADDAILREIMAKNSADYAPVDKKEDQVMTLGDEPMRHQSQPQAVHAQDENPYAKAADDLGLVGTIMSPVGATGASK